MIALVRPARLVALVLVALAAPAVQTASAGKVRPKPVVTPNWSGYVATAPAGSDRYFASATGTWTVPRAHCRPGKRASSSTVWVGLGGFHSGNQEEVGTNSNCSASGKPSYFAWFELVPYLSYHAFPEIKNEVRPGDRITGLVRVINPRLVELRLQNRTRGWTFMRRINYTSQDTSTAEWVVEAPAVCVRYFCHEADLAHFDDVTIDGISATAHNRKGTLIDPRWDVYRVRLVPAKLKVPTILPSPTIDKSKVPIRKGIAVSPAGATPGALPADGRSFTVKWVAVARNV